MIIVKYNCLASYSKLFSDYYGCILRQIKAKKRNINFEYFLENKFMGYKNLDFKKERFLEIINDTNEETISVLEILEDVSCLVPNVLENFLFFTKNIKRKIFFIVFLPDYKKRLYSLIMRNIITVTNRSFNDILLQNFITHTNFFNSELKSFDHINFEKIILFEDMEKLIELNNSGYINLICVSESGTNKPKEYFNMIDLNIENIHFNSQNERRKKEVNLEKLNFFNLFLKENSKLIENRYFEIYNLLQKNNIKLIT